MYRRFFALILVAGALYGVYLLWGVRQEVQTVQSPDLEQAQTPDPQPQDVLEQPQDETQPPQEETPTQPTVPPPSTPSVSSTTRFCDLGKALVYVKLQRDGYNVFYDGTALQYDADIDGYSLEVAAHEYDTQQMLAAPWHAELVTVERVV